jgi:hypothetical protein
MKKGYSGKYVERQDTKWSSSKSHETIEEYMQREDVLVISAKDILPSERIGEVRQQGYVWVD